MFGYNGEKHNERRVIIVIIIGNSQRAFGFSLTIQVLKVWFLSGCESGLLMHCINNSVECILMRRLLTGGSVLSRLINMFFRYQNVQGTQLRRNKESNLRCPGKEQKFYTRCYIIRKPNTEKCPQIFIFFQLNVLNWLVPSKQTRPLFHSECQNFG